jgi:hypothetical protein
LRAALGLALALLLAGAAPAAAGVRVDSGPALYPAFDRDVPEYVVRCKAGEAVHMSFAAGESTTVAVDGKKARAGKFESDVSLVPGQRFQFSVTTPKARRRYSVRCLPPDFPGWSATRKGRPQAEWFVVAPCCNEQTYVAIFDTNGVPVWWVNTHRAPLDASVLANGHVVWAQQHGVDLAPGVSSGVYEEHRLDGHRVRTFSIPGGTPTDRHEMQLLPNGNYIVVGYKPRRGVDLSPYGGPADATVLDALVEEVTPDRKIAWSWNSKDHIALAETGRWYQEQVIAKPAHLEDGSAAYDIVHINAVEPYGRSHALISFRNLDAVYDVSKRTGGIAWKLGGTATPRSLRFLDDPVGKLGAQHDVRVLPDGTITLHDNGTAQGRPPRVVRYRIDPGAGTATLREQIFDPFAQDSPCCGSARKLPGGHWVISWGGIHLVTEVTPAGRHVFALHFDGLMSYRAFPVLPGRLARSALRAGMDAMNPR